MNVRHYHAPAVVHNMLVLQVRTMLVARALGHCNVDPQFDLSGDLRGSSGAIPLLGASISTCAPCPEGSFCPAGTE